MTQRTIAGTLITTELVSSLQSVVGNILTSLCSGSAFQSIAQQIEQASDIIIDPSSGAVSNTSGQMCNGISIGLGFDATEIAAPVAADIEAPPAAAPNPCATDAGTD
jgi:archaellum component FlaG (FlaF/FlaG flagellin family)